MDSSFYSNEQDRKILQEFLQSLEETTEVDEGVRQVMEDMYSQAYGPPYTQIVGEEMIEVSPLLGSVGEIEMAAVEPVVPLEVLIKKDINVYEIMSIVAKAKTLWVEGKVIVDLEIPLFGADVCQKTELAKATMASQGAKARIGRNMVHHVTGFIENLTIYDVLICVGQVDGKEQGIRFDFKDRVVSLDSCVHPAWLRWSVEGDLINLTEDVEVPYAIAPTYVSRPTSECLMLMDAMFYWLPEYHTIVVDVVGNHAVARDGSIIFSDVAIPEGKYETCAHEFRVLRPMSADAKVTHPTQVNMLRKAAVKSDVPQAAFKLLVYPWFELVPEEQVFLNEYGVAYQVMDDMRRKAVKPSRYSFMREAIRNSKGRRTWASLNRECQKKKREARVSCVGYRIFSQVAGRSYQTKGRVVVKIRYKRKHQIEMVLHMTLKVPLELLLALMSGVFFCRYEA